MTPSLRIRREVKGKITRSSPSVAGKPIDRQTLTVQALWLTRRQ